MELVDIYDAQGRPTGKVQDREAPLAAGEYLLAVGVWIVDGEGNILLTQRSPEKRWAPGKWENTAGHAQAGEDCPAAMAREIREEIGLEIAPEQLVPLGSSPATGHYIGENYGLRLRQRPERLTFQPGGDLRRQVGQPPEELERMAQSGELSPSVLSHLEGSYREAFLQFIGRQGSTLLRKG